jgi:hypothetical protein
MLYASVDYAGALSMLGVAPLVVGLALWIVLRLAKHKTLDTKAE